MTTQQQLAAWINCVYLDWGYGDIIELRGLDRNTGKVHRHWATPSWYIENSQWMQKLNSKYDLYFGINPRLQSGKGKSTDIELARCLFAEFDNMTLAEASSRVDNAGLPVPTAIVWSGGGTHLYWRLDEPITDLYLWTGLQKRLILALGSDRTICDPPRIMRIPGFFNHKPGRSASHLVYARSHVLYSGRELHGLLPELPREKTPIRTIKAIESALNCIAYARKALREECRRVADATTGNRHAILIKSAFKLGQLVGAGLLDERTVESMLLDACNCWDSDFSMREKMVTVASGLRAGALNPRNIRK